ncbi:MAG: hypothetical protein K2O16_08345 [Lachnospiraceae bacterium]|nr:hypothetical protein [Lachnospiraceae bacterium]
MDEMNRGNLVEGQQAGTDIASAVTVDMGTGSAGGENAGMGGTGAGNADMGNGMMPGNGKKTGDIIKIIIPAAVLVILVALLVGVALATGVIGSKKKAIMKAAAYTFSQSAGAIGDVWDMKDYEGMFENEQMTMLADLNFGRELGFELEMLADQETCGGYLEVKLYGMSALEADYYADSEEAMLWAPGISDYIFYINRSTMEEDLEAWLEEFDMDEFLAGYAKNLNEDNWDGSLLEEGMLQAGVEFTAAVKNLFDQVQVSGTQSKKLTVDGRERKCKGYTVTITGGQLADFILKYVEIYETNEAFKNYMDTLIAYEFGYTSSEELLEYYDVAEAFEELAVEAEKSGPFTMEFYLYKKALAQIYFDAGDGEYIQWDIMGGSFPLENMDMEIYTGSVTYNLTRSGNYDSRKNTYEAEYKLISDEFSGYEIWCLDLEYNTKKGDFSIDLAYDYNELAIKGDIEKITPGSEFCINIDSLEVNREEVLSGDIYLSNECGDIEKPKEGEKVNVLRLTEDEWYDILWEISENLYSY